MTKTAIRSAAIYRFGHFELDENALTLRRAGELVALPIKPWNTLLLFAQNAPDTVSKTELMDAVWQGRTVTEGVLTQVVSRLRMLMGDEAQEIIKTVHGIGFRLMLPVTSTPVVPVAQEAEVSIGMILRDRPLWQLSKALSTSKHAAVWLATRQVDGEQRVFKLATDGAGLRALKRELSVTRVMQAAQCAEGICEVIDADFDAPPFFLELPYYPAGNLVDFCDTYTAQPSATLAEGSQTPLDRATRIQILVEIAQGLAHCHAAGIIHGDIKPKNILIEVKADQRISAKLADFGAAVLVDQERLKKLQLSAINQTGSLLNDPGSGTLVYAAPELLAGKPTSTASDVYALGVTAFQLLCGEFSRPLSPGWEDLIDDELLRRDISDMCQADAARRPSVSEVAEGWKTLTQRAEAAADLMRRKQQQAQDAARIQYLINRKRMLWFAVAGLVTLLGVTSTAMVLVNRERQMALTQAEEAKRASHRADALRETVMQSLIDATNPTYGGNASVKVVELMEPLSTKLNNELQSEPAYAARITHSFAIALMFAKNYPAAERLYRSTLKNDLPDNVQAESRMGLADVLMMQGKSAEAIENYSYAVKHSTERQVLMRSRTLLATNYMFVGKPEMALSQIEEVRKIVPVEGVSDSFRYGFMSKEGEALVMLNKVDEAEVIFKRLIDMTENSQEKKGYAQLGIRGLAKVELARGNVANAILLQEKAISNLDERLLLGSRRNYEIELATMLLDAKQYERAETILRHHLDDPGRLKALGPYFAAKAQVQLSRIYAHQGKRTEAASLLYTAKAWIESGLGKDSTAYQRVLLMQQDLAKH